MELDFSQIYIYSEQPVSCPLCGARTNILLDLPHTIKQTQIHKCLYINCRFEFVMENGL